MRKRMKRILTGTLTAALAASMIPAGAMAQGSGADRSGQTGGFVTDAPLQLEKTGGVTIGTADKDGGVAEIAAYNKDNQNVYVVNGQQGLLNMIPVNADGSLGTPKEIQVKDLISGFQYGDMTSVDVDTVNKHIVIALQAADYAKAGRIAVLDYDGNLVASYETGVQPDMIKVSKDGQWILTADEGEPREGYGEGTADPAGSVTIVNTKTNQVTIAGFDKFDAQALAKEGVLFNKIDGKMLSAAQDLEPEYIALDPSGSKAYVSLQEANAIAVLDLNAGVFTSVKSAGFQDYSKAGNEIDLVEDGGYHAALYKDAVGVRMPDGISTFEVNGVTYIATANEGDAREWGDFTNEEKETLTAADGKEAEKVRVLDKNVTAVPDENLNYIFGSRSFSIFRADNMELVYDSGSGFESETAKFLPEYFNCSNDDIEIDSRSAKKGPEPEAVTVNEVDGREYAFIALERIGGIMVYDVTNPSESSFVNYINTRDFSGEISGDVAPEGLAFVSGTDSPSGQNILLAANEVSGTVSAYTVTQKEDTAEKAGAAVLYTNDVHCAVSGYSTLAAYRAQLMEEGYDVITVDAGDAIQGEAIGSMTEGSAIVDLMNTVGYDFAVPGNHEFDYGMDRFLELAENEAEYTYLSSNFKDLRTGETVFEPYEIVEMNGEDVAFVGISTPETYTKSTPTYFQDENGNYIYSFSEDELYDTVQDAADSARAAGADKVIAVGHLGIEGTTEGWKSVDVIANTTGIDAFIDAHSHETIRSDTYKNKNGENVTLTSTGTKFADFGVMKLEEDGTITTELLTLEDVNTESSEAVKTAYQTVQDKIDGYNEELAPYLNEKIGESEVKLTVNEAEDDSVRRIRNGETNMGDFVADAYREVTGADIALVNGGGIRASIEAGDVTRKNIMDVNPWNNEMCVIKATGQQILDALEHGTRMNPEECGGFLQVSGLTYEIHNYLDSPVVTDDKEMFQNIDASKERRVQNVMVGGQAIDPEKVYTVAGSEYTLKQGGDGFTMFADCEYVKHGSELPVDADMLMQYFTDELDGQITADRYGSLTGDGRIRVLAEEPAQNPSGDQNTGADQNTPSGDQNTGADQNTPSDDQKPETDQDTGETMDSPKTSDAGQARVYGAAAAAAAVLAGAVYAVKRKKKEA